MFFVSVSLPLVKLKAKVQALLVLWNTWKQLVNCRLHLQVLQMRELKHLLRDCWNFVPVQFQYLKCGRQIVKGTRLHGGYSVTVNVPVETMSRRLNLQLFNKFLIPSSETQSSCAAYSLINGISFIILVRALDSSVYGQIVFHHEHFAQLWRSILLAEDSMLQPHCFILTWCSSGIAVLLNKE